MYVILVYDICFEKVDGKKRLPKVMKICRRFLHHSQKSVFEGEISEAGLLELKTTLERVIKKDEDSLVIFRLANKNNLEKEFLGKKFDATTNIL